MRHDPQVWNRLLESTQNATPFQTHSPTVMVLGDAGIETDEARLSSNALLARSAASPAGAPFPSKGTWKTYDSHPPPELSPRHRYASCGRVVPH
jgi:hypothetical protein